MKEVYSVVLVSLLLISIGIAIFVISNVFYSDFNFYKSELKINEENIIETLYFKPDKDYHTLYRNFFDPVYSTYSDDSGSYILMNKVYCNYGKSYSKNFYGEIKIYKSEDFTEDIPYTEPNEYGCSFGNNLGFKEGIEYSISGEFNVIHKNLFLIDGKYYKKYIAYSKDKHKLLIKDKNFFVEGIAATKKIYFPNEYVAIYIPYEGEIKGYYIIKESDFKFGTFSLYYFFFYLAPGILFFIIWIFFGREKKHYFEVPEQISNPPNNRKPYEVAAYFHPPFSVMDNEFFSAMLMDLYKRKIIEIKFEEKSFTIGRKKDLLIKINNYNRIKVDEIEGEFLEILKYLNEKSEYKKGEYFNLIKTSQSLLISFTLRSKMRKLQKNVKKNGKVYLNKTGIKLYSFSLLILFLFSYSILTFSSTIFIFLCLFLTGFINNKSALLTKYKEEYYKEYQEWQAFRKWLSYSPSMKMHGTKGVIIWDKYLIYGAGLGISLKVIKELKNQGLISEGEFNTYSGIHHSSTSFTTYSGTRGSSSGEAGGGGAGGGGGGGR